MSIIEPNMDDPTPAIHAEIVNVKPLTTRQQCSIVVEIPIEYFADAAQWFGRRVLITAAPDSMAEVPYGVVDA